MNKSLKSVIDFGRMPIANAFLAPEEFASEYFYDMVVGYDRATDAIGLVNTVPPEKMFHGNYAFFSSTSKGMQKHFRETAEKLKPLVGEGMVVEVGSNDGIVFGANVSCHIEDIEGYFKSIAALIGKTGVFVFEDPYFLDIVEKTSYDQVYDEHVWYFTISFINNLFGELGYHVFDCEHVPVHGGELRMYVGHKDTHQAGPAVGEWKAREDDIPGKLELLKGNIVRSKENMRQLLSGLKSKGKRMCGFGASSKGVIVCNYCGIGPELIPFITDNTPTKQGKYYPGVHIPVRPQEEFKDVDVAVLFAWNHLAEIEKLPIIQEFRAKGGKLLTHVPEPHVF